LIGAFRKYSGSLFLLFLLFFSTTGFLPSTDRPVVGVSVGDHPGYSRVILRSSVPLSTSVEKSEAFLFVKIRTSSPFRFQREPFRSRLVKALDWTQGRGFAMLTVQTSDPDFTFETSRVSDPPSLVIDLKPEGGKAEDISGGSAAPVPAEQPETVGAESAPSDQECIVIDPGHGGLETGAKGKFGTLEKDLTLALGLKLAEIIRQRRASNVVLTRDRDIDTSLEERAAVANNNRATVFISIHVNSSYRKGAAGPETFFLSLNATDEEARRLAYLENNSSRLEQDIDSDDEDVIKMILWDMAQTAYIQQSSRLAEFIQNELNLLWGTANRGIKQAPFKVLTGVACPAVLVEVAFLSNAQEERKLLNETYQDRVAEAIFNGLSRFLKENDR